MGQRRGGKQTQGKEKEESLRRMATCTPTRRGGLITKAGATLPPSQGDQSRAACL